MALLPTPSRYGRAEPDTEAEPIPSVRRYRRLKPKTLASLGEHRFHVVLIAQDDPPDL
ncbi:MAG: hypothetical protein ACK4QP_12050 [Pseudorhizobium sp.]